jgi:hypothetical protein
MTKYERIIFQVLLLVMVFAAGCNTEPQYTLGVKNLSGTELKDVTVSLHPKGKIDCGTLTSNNPIIMKNPTWPVPSIITVVAKDEYGNVHTIENRCNIPLGFRGDITIEIIRFGNKFDFQLRRTTK